jgi:molybdopterin synthase sulfur carrier subunit
MTNLSGPATESEAGTTAAQVIVRVPSQLRTLTGGAGDVGVPAGTIGDIVAALEASYPGFAERLLDEGGSLRRFVNVFVAEEDVRFLQGLDTRVEGGQTVSIVPAVAGG